MTKILQFNEDALKSILRGVRLLTRAVQATMGPKGKNVVINQGFGMPLSTKDGVTVAEEVNLSDPFENMGAQIVKEVASKTADRAGDGTTTAIVLACAIYSAGVKNVTAGANPAEIKQGIEIAVETIVKELESLAKPVKSSREIQQVAAISANNDASIGDILAKAMEKVGNDGIISTSEGKTMKTEVEIKEGLQFENGFLSPYFITNPESMSTELSDAAILLVDKKISTVRELVPILEKTMSQNTKPLLIIAEDVEGEALATLVMNKIQAGLPLCAVKAPGFGDHRKAILEDIAILTGATVVSEETGMSLQDAEPSVLGFAKTIQITKEETTIIDGKGKAAKIKDRSQQIRALIDNDNTSDFEKEKLEKRLAMMVGGVALIQVGAATEMEMKEKKARVEDALHATRAAIAKGIVPGGGVALLRAVKALDKLSVKGDQAIGVQIVRGACFAPATTIANNCGKPGNLIAEKVYESKNSIGFNGLTEEFTDLVDAGVIDPVLVTISALINAASVAGLLLRTATIIAEKKKPTPKAAPMEGGMGGMGGMGMM